MKNNDYKKLIALAIVLSLFSGALGSTGAFFLAKNNISNEVVKDIVENKGTEITTGVVKSALEEMGTVEAQSFVLSAIRTVTEEEQTPGSFLFTDEERKAISEEVIKSITNMQTLTETQKAEVKAMVSETISAFEEKVNENISAANKELEEKVSLQLTKALKASTSGSADQTSGTAKATVTAPAATTAGINPKDYVSATEFSNSLKSMNDVIKGLQSQANTSAATLSADQIAQIKTEVLASASSKAPSLSASKNSDGSVSISSNGSVIATVPAGKDGKDGVDGKDASLTSDEKAALEAAAINNAVAKTMEYFQALVNTQGSNVTIDYTGLTEDQINFVINKLNSELSDYVDGRFADAGTSLLTPEIKQQMIEAVKASVDVTEDIGQINTDLAQAVANIGTLQTAVQTLEAGYLTSEDAASTYVAKDDSVYTTALNDLDTVKNNITALRAAVGTVDGSDDLNDLKSLIDALDTRATALETDLNGIPARVTTAEGNITALGDKIALLASNDELAALQTEGKTLADKLSALATSLSDYATQSDLDTANGKISALETTVNGDGTNPGLANQVAGILTTLDGDGSGGLNSQVGTLESKVGTLETALGNGTTDGLIKTVGNSSSGLVHDVAALQSALGDSDSGLIANVAALQIALGNGTTNGLIKNVAALQTSLGDITTLSTTTKTSIVGAVNELFTSIGTLNTLLNGNGDDNPGLVADVASLRAVATNSADGLMSKEDKEKLDAISTTYATNTTVNGIKNDLYGADGTSGIKKDVADLKTNMETVLSASGHYKNVQADFNEDDATSDAYIKYVPEMFEWGTENGQTKLTITTPSVFTKTATP